MQQQAGATDTSRVTAAPILSRLSMAMMHDIPTVPALSIVIVIFLFINIHVVVAATMNVARIVRGITVQRVVRRQLPCFISWQMKRCWPRWDLDCTIRHGLMGMDMIMEMLMSLMTRDSLIVMVKGTELLQVRWCSRNSCSWTCYCCGWCAAAGTTFMYRS